MPQRPTTRPDLIPSPTSAAGRLGCGEVPFSAWESGSWGFRAFAREASPCRISKEQEVFRMCLMFAKEPEDMESEAALLSHCAGFASLSMVAGTSPPFRTSHEPGSAQVVEEYRVLKRAMDQKIRSRRAANTQAL